MAKTLNFVNDDIELIGGNFTTVTDLEGLRQKIDQKLQFFHGEWFLNATEGIPYFEEILVKPADAGLVASIFNNVILSEAEVTGIRDVEADLDASTRTFTYRAKIETIFGDTEVTNNG